jgi:hypothetical protein
MSSITRLQSSMDMFIIKVLVEKFNVHGQVDGNLVSIESIHKNEVQQGRTPTKVLGKFGDGGDGVVQKELLVATPKIGTNVEYGNIVDVGGQRIANNLSCLHGVMSNASMPSVLGQVSQSLKVRLCP